MYQIDIQLSKKVFGKVMAYILLRKFIYVYIIIGFIDLILAINHFALSNGSISWTNYLFPAGFTLFFVLVPLGQIYYGWGWENNPLSGQLAKCVLANNGIKIDGTTYHASHEWSNFMGVKQINVAIVLFISQNLVFILPNESFSSVTERAKVLDFIREQIPIVNQSKSIFPTLKRFFIIVSIFFAFIILLTTLLIFFLRK